MYSLYRRWSNIIKKESFAQDHTACRGRAEIPISLPNFKPNVLDYAIAFNMCYKCNIVRSQTNELSEP